MLDRRTFLNGIAMSTTNAAPKFRVIDSHVHVWKRDPRYPFAKETTKPPEFDATPEMLLDLMHANGVEKTVIIQVIHYRWDNSYLLDVLKQYPQMFRGVARVNPQDPEAPDHLSRLTEQGFRGVRLSPNAEPSSDWIQGALMPPLWQRCADLKVPMTILAPISRMPDIGRLADRYPDLTIVIDHMADCPVDQPRELDKLIALKRHPKLFVKVSHTWSLSHQPFPYLDAQEHVKRLHQAFGPRRLMWATDWPIVLNSHCTYQNALRLVREDWKFLNDDDRAWLMSRTIEQVWPFS
jgi:predicted TIM-barrel fold metal-dependent hydrolase